MSFIEKIRVPMVLKPDHPAFVEGRTLRPGRRRDPATSVPMILKPGSDNQKLGGWVIKGDWTGSPIYSLTLEERATCWEGCKHWADCYGNHMVWGHRFAHGPALEARLRLELPLLAQRHPHGFAVRLHVLGDFYSPEYVMFWMEMLTALPALRVFGFTGWPPSSDIGRKVDAVRTLRPKQFRVRFSDYEAVTIDQPNSDALICPQQMGTSESCGACTLCWAASYSTVVHFLRH